MENGISKKLKGIEVKVYGLSFNASITEQLTHLTHAQEVWSSKISERAYFTYFCKRYSIALKFTQLFI